MSICGFLLTWDKVAAWQVFGDSLAQPWAVLQKLYQLSSIKFAGTNLIGYIWASTQRVLIGFFFASLFAVPLGLFMALNRYANAIVKPIFDLFKPMPPIAWVLFRNGIRGKGHRHDAVSKHGTECKNLLRKYQ